MISRPPRNKCPTRRLPTNPGVSLSLADGTRLSVAKTGRSVIVPAGDLPGGFWLTDMSYSEVCLLNNRKINRIIHSDGWIGAPWRRIMRDCGLKTRVTRGDIQGLAEISERIIRLSVHAVTNTGYWINSGQRISDRRTFGRPSLAFGLSDYLRPLLGKPRPSNAALARLSTSLLLYGSGSRAAEFGQGRIITAVKPRFTYLRWLAQQPAPGAGMWREIKLPGSSSPITDAMQAGFLNLRRPVILSGAFQPSELGGPAWSRGWLKGVDPSWGRSCFTLEEVICLRRAGLFHVDCAYAGPRRRRPAENTALGAVSAGLAAACGSSRSARCSWSAGRASENLIRAACGGFKRRLPPAMEAVWIAAHDRIACLPAVEAAEAAGGVFLSSVAGAVTFGVKGAAADAARVADALWEQGLHLHAGTARRLKEEGVNLLTDAGRFGGRKEDLLMAAASQRGLCGLVRRMDQLTGGGKSGRNRRLDALEAVVERFP